MPPDPSRLDWEVVDDGVMGGRSRGRVESMSPGVRFSGILSIENGGGFSSIRAPVGSVPDTTDGFRLAVTGDGRRYQFRLRDSARPDAPAWRVMFDTTGKCQTVVLALADFEPVLRGRRLSHALMLDASEIRLLGFMLTSRRLGSFALEVHAIEYLESRASNA